MPLIRSNRSEVRARKRALHPSHPPVGTPFKASSMIGGAVSEAYGRNGIEPVRIQR